MADDIRSLLIRQAEIKRDRYAKEAKYQRSRTGETPFVLNALCEAEQDVIAILQREC